MFSKRLLASIVIDKKKLKKSVKGSCYIEIAPLMEFLSEEEYKKLRNHLNNACVILRRAFIKREETRK